MPPNSLRDSRAAGKQRERYATGMDSSIFSDLHTGILLADRKSTARKQQLAQQFGQAMRKPAPTKITANGKPSIRITK